MLRKSTPAQQNLDFHVLNGLISQQSALMFVIRACSSQVSGLTNPPTAPTLPSLPRLLCLFGRGAPKTLAFRAFLLAFATNLILCSFRVCSKASPACPSTVSRCLHASLALQSPGSSVESSPNPPMEVPIPATDDHCRIKVSVLLTFSVLTKSKHYSFLVSRLGE